MLLLIPSVFLVAGLIALYRWRMRSVPWVFLLVATIVILQGSIIEAFGVQAGAELGSSSLIVLLVVTIAGFFAIRPVWRLEITAIMCALGAVLALVTRRRRDPQPSTKHDQRVHPGIGLGRSSCISA